jgi:peptidyl-prolyl cis-trans isomerase D
MKEQKFQIKEQRTKRRSESRGFISQNKSESDSFMMLAFSNSDDSSAARWDLGYFSQIKW